MRKLIAFVLGFLVLLAGCSSVERASMPDKSFQREPKPYPPVHFLPTDLKVVSAGDSLTQGVGGVEGLGGYIPSLKESLETIPAIGNVEFENFGVRGNKTSQLLKRLKQDQVRSAIGEADLIIITIGGNDVMQVFKENLMGLKLKKFTAAEKGYKKRLTEILTAVRAENENAPILLVGIYNPFMKWFSEIKEVDTIVKNWNKQSFQVVSEFDNASFVPVADLFEKDAENLLYTDYFHPNPDGYVLIANRIFTHMEAEGFIEKLTE